MAWLSDRWKALLVDAKDWENSDWRVTMVPSMVDLDDVDAFNALAKDIESGDILPEGVLLPRLAAADMLKLLDTITTQLDGHKLRSIGYRGCHESADGQYIEYALTERQQHFTAKVSDSLDLLSYTGWEDVLYDYRMELRHFRRISYGCDLGSGAALHEMQNAVRVPWVDDPVNRSRAPLAFTCRLQMSPLHATETLAQINERLRDNHRPFIRLIGDFLLRIAGPEARHEVQFNIWPEFAGSPL